MIKPATRPIAHIDFIDGLRAIAVLSVIVCHLYPPLLPGGFAGVDAFFVISGFVVSASVSHLRSPRLGEFLSFFYARRIARIIPALLVFLLVTFPLASFVIPPGWLSQNYQLPGLFAFFGLSNFALSSSAGDYFSPIADFNPFTHTWSLGVEEQFYLVFPALFITWLWPKWRYVSLGLVTVVSLASLAAAGLHLGPPQGAYYLPWQRMWELGLGVVTFQLCSLRAERQAEPVHPKIHLFASLVSLSLLAVGLWSAKASLAPYPAVVLPVLGTAGLLASLFRSPSGPVKSLLTIRVLRFIGRISYSLYLWHWGVFVLFRWTFGLHSFSSMVFALGATFGLAVLSYAFIENRFRRMAKASPRWLTLGCGAACIAVAFGIATQVQQHEEDLSLSTVVRHKTEWYPDLEYTHIEALHCSLKLSTELVGGGTEWTYQRDRDCVNSTSFAHRIYLVGDSHAMHYRRMLSRLVLETGATVSAYHNGGCPLYSFLPLDPALQPQCEKYTRAALDDILKNARPGDILLLASLRTPRIMDQWAHLYTLQDAIAVSSRTEFLKVRREQEAEAIEVLQQMTARGIKVAFVAPTGLSPRVNYRCADWFNRMNPICVDGDAFPRADLEALRKPALESFSNVQHRVPQVLVWDPFPQLCPGDPCRSMQAGKPLYFDSDHLTAYSNDILYASFLDFIRKMEGSDDADVALGHSQ